MKKQTSFSDRGGWRWTCASGIALIAALLAVAGAPTETTMGQAAAHSVCPCCGRLAGTAGIRYNGRVRIVLFVPPPIVMGSMVVGGLRRRLAVRDVDSDHRLALGSRSLGGMVDVGSTLDHVFHSLGLV